MKIPADNSVDQDFFSENDALPEGWKLAELGSVAKYTNGMAFKPSDWEKKGRPIIRIQNLTKSTNVVNRYSKEVDKKLLVRDGDLLISWSATLGAYIYSGEEAVLNQHIFRVEPFIDKIDKKFLFYSVNFHITKLEKDAHGSGMVHITKGFFEKITIPLPPLPEQQRIVARVEALLTHVDAARERLSRVPLIMKKFRQAVLAAACEGKLTEGWRESCGELESSTVLFSKIQTDITQRHLNFCEIAKKTGGRKPKDERRNKKSDKPVIDLPELPETWEYYRLEDLSYLITDGTHVTPEYLDKGIPFLSVKNIRPFSISVDNIKLVSPEEHRLMNQRCNPEFQDILYTKVGSYGYAVQNKLEYPFSLFVSVALIKPVKKYFIPDYAEIVMNSPIVFEQANDRVSGSSTPDLHLIEIRDFRIPLPPLAEQHEIVRRVNALFARADAVELEVAVATKRAEALTQAVLGKAFMGELVPTDAELARKEPA